ncbi:F-box/kelch-repeat protein At3g06240-like [Silene latifolia]|uniref:F-box/kelch-repeat protein At3g06240-like n=1 Tax=Silene latifolia TaxID=37657 RepID=UPI003D77AA41
MKRIKNSTTSSKLPYISPCNYLPPEVWAHILSNLPAKTLLRIRCVCKSWCFIIDDPDFAHMHFQHSQINYGHNNKLLVDLESMGKFGDQGCLLTVRDAQTLAKIDQICEIHSDKYRILGSCNGLLLVKRSGFTYNREPLRLWNPSIRKSLILPTCPLRPYLFDGLSCYLFGFAPRSKNYNVVAFELDDSLGKGNEKMYFSVYILSNQQWTVKNALNTSNLNTNNTYGLFYYLSTAVFFRGAAYWLGNNDKRTQALTHLASFDFDQENITILELPFSWDENTYRFLFLLGESLAIFSISKASSSIWVLQQDNEKEPWTLWFSGKSSWAGYEVFNLCYIASQKVFYCEGDGGYFVCGNKAYNIASCQVKPFERSMSSDLNLETYWESLVLSKAYGARDLRSFP